MSIRQQTPIAYKSTGCDDLCYQFTNITFTKIWPVVMHARFQDLEACLFPHHSLLLSLYPYQSKRLNVVTSIQLHHNFTYDSKGDIFWTFCICDTLQLAAPKHLLRVCITCICLPNCYIVSILFNYKLTSLINCFFLLQIALFVLITPV